MDFSELVFPLRAFVAIEGAVLIALLLKLAWVRRRWGREEGMVPPFGIFAIALLVLASILRQTFRFGDMPTWFLVYDLIVFTMALYALRWIVSIRLDGRDSGS